MQSAEVDARSLLEAATAQAVDAIAIVTAERDFAKSRIVYANDACGKLLGCTAAELLGRSRLALAGGRPVPGLLERARAAAANPEQPFFASLTRVRPDGTHYDVEGHLAPLRNERGEVTHYLVTQHDVTERNRAERDLRTALLRSDRLRSTSSFAAGAAYGLRDPLSRTLGNLELATALVDRTSRDERPGDVAQALTDATESARCLRDIVSDLGALAQDRGPTEPVDVDTALDLALDLTAFELAPRAHVERERRPLPPVRANLARLTQAFIHLLRNAAQAIPGEQPAHNWVRIRTLLDDDGRVVIVIADSGEGIEPGDLPQVFEPFFTTRPAPVAVGLGLSIAQATVVALGGDITITSAIGRGTLVRVALPSCEAARPPQLPVRPRFAQRQLVLVVHDDPSTYPVYARMLESDRAVVSFARPEEALERLALGEAIDLVVCDPAMRWKPELTFRQELEASTPHAASRVLELSARAVARAPAAGPRPELTPPRAARPRTPASSPAG